MGTTTRTVSIPEQVSPVVLLGPFDEILRLIESGFPTLTFVVRGRKIEILSHSAADERQAMQARGFLRQMIGAAAHGEALDAAETKRLLETRPPVDKADSDSLAQQSSSLPSSPLDGDGQSSQSEAADRRKESNFGNAAQRASRFEVPYRASKRTYFSTSVRTARKKEERRHLAAEKRSWQEKKAARTRREGERKKAKTGRPVLEKVLKEDNLARKPQRFSRQTEHSQEPEYIDSPQPIVISQGQPVRPKTAGQRKYVEAISRNTITFGIGPAGTGKTYLAVAKAVEAFETRQVRRIILTRPAVEAGENLGFLPGTLNDKIDPYLRPLYDALSDMLGPERLHEETEDGSIEVAPLAYMRGRTLNDAFVILDEAQNTTEQQMKMFLTRLGFNTKMVVTGDATQVDLAVHRSGLRTIEQILHGIDSIAFVHLGAADVVRHELVGKIVNAYNRHDEKLRQARERVREGRDDER